MDGGATTPAAPPDDSVRDVVIVGAGPAGSTAAYRAASLGLRVIVLEQGRHPRFHIGESMLPRNMTMIREIGLAEGLSALPQVYKIGASFAFGHEDETRDYHFVNALRSENHEAFNIERAPFDQYLTGAARSAGAEVYEGISVRRIVDLNPGNVSVAIDGADGRPRLIRGRYLIDASGQATLVGRHLGIRRTLPDLCKVSCFAHFRDVFRPAGDLGGYPRIIMCDEGWFWFIPLDERRTSIGVVMDMATARSLGVPTRQLLRWAVDRCPLARTWIGSAEFPADTWSAADFSYSCDPYAGPGYFMVGDAATFIDPIFSTGVCMGMMSAVEAVDHVQAILAGERRPELAIRRYRRYVHHSSSAFFRLVRAFYTHSFRELFLQGVGPLQVHRALTSVLTGHVFPRPALALRWRLRLFWLLVALQRHLPIAPRRPGFSLMAADAPRS